MELLYTLVDKKIPGLNAGDWNNSDDCKMKYEARDIKIKMIGLYSDLKIVGRPWSAVQICVEWLGFKGLKKKTHIVGQYN